MKKANIQIGVGELEKVVRSCVCYAAAAVNIQNSIEGYLAGDVDKDSVLAAVHSLRMALATTDNINAQIVDACGRIESSTKYD